jgi:ketosteroid isomerase-like protein
MPAPASPREVIERLLDGIANERWQELHELYAEDAIIEYPFALPTPRRLDGREAIRKYFEAAAKLPLKLRPRNICVRETGDPEVVVVQYDYDGLVTGAGKSFQVSNIQVSRIRDGVIASSRDYHNHAVLADAMGQLSAVLAAMKNT